MTENGLCARLTKTRPIEIFTPIVCIVIHSRLQCVKNIPESSRHVYVYTQFKLPAKYTRYVARTNQIHPLDRASQ